MQNTIGKSSSGNPVYRGYAISVVNDKEGKYLLCGQWYQTLEEATAAVDEILARQDEDICKGCGYHVTRCRMTTACAPFYAPDPEA